MLGLMTIGLASCGRNEQMIGRPELTVAPPGTDMPVPTVADMVEQQRPYVVGPADKLDIAVLGVPELTRQYQLDTTGRFSMPMVGEVAAVGQTPGQLQTLIADRLRGRYVRDPQVSVNVDTSNQFVTVEGQVRQPGLYPMVPQMSLVRSIARAQGLTDFGNTNYVVIFRRVSGQNYAAVYDLRAIRQGAYGDPIVYANDIVYVGDSQARRLLPNILQGAGLLLSPLVTLVR